MGIMIALLRGINVGGKVLKMDLARASLEALGLTDVRTYVQSGNFVFSTRAAASSLGPKIAARLRADASLEVSVIVKTPREIEKVMQGNPFLAERGIDPKTLHVTFLAEAPTKAGLVKLAAINAEVDRFRHAGREIFVHCPNGYGRTKLTNAAIEKSLGVVATTRNWNTITKLHEMAAE